MTWCIDLTAGRVDVTTRVAHAFRARADGALEMHTVCGLLCELRQDVAHTHYAYTRCERCREREAARG